MGINRFYAQTSVSEKKVFPVNVICVSFSQSPLAHIKVRLASCHCHH